jgi:hypothetical protein
VAYPSIEQSQALSFYSPLTGPRLGTANIDLAELSAMQGQRYGLSKIFSNFDIAVPFYALLENPSDSGVVIAFQERKLKTETDGLTSSQILWDYDVSTATKTNIPIFNQNNNFRVSNPSKLEASVLNAVTVPSPDRGAWNITGAATIVSQGIERESDFIPTSGVGSHSTGDVSAELGIRIYYPGTGALIKAVSAGNDNRLLWGYDWFEIPIGFFGG